MTRRVFVSSLRTGLASATKAVGPDGRPTFQPSVTLVRRSGGADDPSSFDGPDLAVLGPGDVLGIDVGQVVRQEPPPGTLDAEANNLVTLDLADATLPWLLTLPTMRGRPWIALLVVREDEGELDTRGRVPSLTFPAHALPDPDDLIAWTHVEARVEPGEDLPGVLQAEARTGTDRVVARLLCPRVLEDDASWLACLVPTTMAGVRAALGGAPPEDAAAPAWTRQGGPATLPVYHHWRFRTGADGSFERLALRVQPMSAQAAGIGERVLDVRYPWPHGDLLGADTPADLTVAYQGALRPPGAAVPAETWSDSTAQQTFRSRMEEVLGREQPDGTLPSEGVAPPLYGSHHTGHRTVPGSGWMRDLNLEVRYRLAASLGARYVQLEQEFLMERAWEQVGEIREANRVRAQAELAAQAAAAAQAKHLQPMEPVALTELADPAATSLPVLDRPLAEVLARSAVPDGTASTAFRRLARRGGAVDRRTARSAGRDRGALATAPVVSQGLSGTSAVPPQPMAFVVAGAVTDSPTVAVDRASTYGAGAMAGLLRAQEVQFTMHAFQAGSGSGPMGQAASAFTAMGGGAMVTGVAAGELREQRLGLTGFSTFEVPAVSAPLRTEVGTVSGDILTGLVPLPKQVERMEAAIETTGVPVPVDPPRPLRPVMAHPRFGFPVAAELLARWPDWTVPGITDFPENRCCLLETSSAFVESVLVGLNQEFNRELLWREYPTDQAGTPFPRFWPGSAEVYDEIAHWGDGDALGDHDPVSAGELPGEEDLVLLMRADVLQRYPGSVLLAVEAGAAGIVPETGGNWREPHFLLPLDDRTCLFGFDLSLAKARQERWLFVLREPMRGTQFGFDIDVVETPPLSGWDELAWPHVPQRDGIVVPRSVPGTAAPTLADPADQPTWRDDPVDLARIAFQRPYQVAFSPGRLVQP